MERLQELIKQIEKEENFERVVELFGDAAKVVKELVSTSSRAKGKVVELVREMDAFVEKELKVGTNA